MRVGTGMSPVCFDRQDLAVDASRHSSTPSKKLIERIVDVFDADRGRVTKKSPAGSRAINVS
jgi:hypothetical protein